MLRDLISVAYKQYDEWKADQFEIPYAANFVVGTYVIVEISDDGNEGLVYGWLTTVHNLGNPFARAIANQIFQRFKPDISNAFHYIEDTHPFRSTVAWSYALSYAFTF